MGAARRWKRKQTQKLKEHQRSIGPWQLWEGDNVSVVLDNDFDGTAAGWQCMKCGVGGSTLFPHGDDREALTQILADFSNVHRECEHEPSASAPANVAEAFDNLREMLDVALREGSQAGPTAIIIGTTTCLECPPFKDDNEKQLSFSLFRTGCRKLLAENPQSTGVAVSIEGWRNLNPDMRPSLDPSRTECLTLLALTDFGVFIREYSIEREGGKPGEGRGWLTEVSSPSGVTFFAPAFQTCAARPVFRAGESQLLS